MIILLLINSMIINKKIINLLIFENTINKKGIQVNLQQLTPIHVLSKCMNGIDSDSNSDFWNPNK